MELPPTNTESSNLRSWVAGIRILSEFFMCKLADMCHDDPGFQHPLDDTNHASGLFSSQLVQSGSW